jgi:hypothetical protein
MAAAGNLRESLATDPLNVFAHVMLNVMMQTEAKGGSAAAFPDRGEQNRKALRSCAATGRHGYPHDGDAPGTHPRRQRHEAQWRASQRSPEKRILTYNPTVNSAEEIKEASRFRPADAWATYNWRCAGDEPGDVAYQRLRHDFIQASLLEIEGKREAALAAFESLRGELKRRKYNGRIVSHVDTAIKRLSLR